MEPSGPLPLVVGVTGHRDICLEHKAELRSAIAAALRELSGPLQNPLIILTGLARGADRLVAEVALAEGHGLVAALPVAKTFYEEEFYRLGEGQGSVDEFRRILAGARNTYVVPDSLSEGGDRYAGLGREIARASQIVLALWDGNEDRLPGGTGWVVDERLGRHPAGCIPGGPPTGAVYQILVHREGNCPGKVIYSTNWLQPVKLGAGDKNLTDLQQHVGSYIADFNNNARAISDLKQADVEEFYVIADRLALKFRKRTDFAWGAIFSLVFLAAVSFGVFAHAEHHDLVYLLSYAGLVASAFGINAWAKSVNLQNKGQDYRALAEGLRISCAWRLLPISDFVSYSYLARQADETRWIRYALGAIERASAPKAKLSEEEAVASAMRTWIRPELEYYEHSTEKVHSIEQIFERISKVTLAASATLGLSLFFAKAMTETELGHFVEVHFEAILITSTILAIAAALTHNLIEKRALKEHLRRYGRMKRMLENTADRIEPATGKRDITTEESICLLRAVSQEVLDENAEWLQTHRDRPLEIPHAG